MYIDYKTKALKDMELFLYKIANFVERGIRNNDWTVIVESNMYMDEIDRVGPAYFGSLKIDSNVLKKRLPSLYPDDRSLIDLGLVYFLDRKEDHGKERTFIKNPEGVLWIKNPFGEEAKEKTDYVNLIEELTSKLEGENYIGNEYSIIRMERKNEHVGKELKRSLGGFETLLEIHYIPKIGKVLHFLKSKEICDKWGETRK
jgi:hypothetical protein